MIILLLITIMILYFYFYVKQKQNLWEEKGIKYVKPTFFIGNARIIRNKSSAEHLKELYSHYPEERYHGVYQFLQPALIVKDPDLIKQVAIKEFVHFSEHTTYTDPDVDPYWGKNLLFSEAKKWKILRSALTPAFTSSKIRMMYGLMDECAQEFVQYFKNGHKRIIELEVKDILSRYSNDVIASTAFGQKCDSLRDPTNSFYMMGKAATDFSSFKFLVYAISPAINKLLKLKMIPTHVTRFFFEIIENTIKFRKEKNTVRPDMIQLLMEAQKLQDSKITLEDITTQGFLFFVAGFETVATHLAFAFYELAINSTIQDRLRDELLTIQDNVCYENITKLKYLDMVICETLRKWPATMYTDRTVTKAFTIQPERTWEKPLHLEKGLSCWLGLYALHNDPKYWPEPEKFNPERFSEKNKHKINSSVYMPFGVGPRKCIGSKFALLEIKLLLCHVLTNFKIVPIAKTKIPMVLDKSQFNLTAEGGMWLGLEKI